MPDHPKHDLLFSVKPIYADKIVRGEKTVELRRRFTGEMVIGSIAFIYSSSPVQALVGYARIAGVQRLPVREIWKHYGQRAGIARHAFDEYFRGVADGYAIVLKDARQLDSTVGVADLKRRFGFVPPQSFSYVTPDYKSLLLA